MAETHFADRLSARCATLGPLCAGLDPRPAQLPADLDAVAWARETTVLLGPQVAAIKPQLAFFGDRWDGPREVAGVAASAGCLVIADAKRGTLARRPRRMRVSCWGPTARSTP